jgi:GMP synthase (glutamine-hydrolysing)
MGSLADILAGAGLDVRQYDLFDSLPGDLPWSNAAGLIALGGPMSANDGDWFPFLNAELFWMRRAIQEELPLLGICLGAQLLAKALGARVYRNARAEIGWYEVDLLPAAAEDPLFCGRSARETVFQWHGDTFGAVPGGVHLAASSLCRQQAFRYGATAYGLQFHVEMTPKLLKSWLEDYEAAGETCGGELIDPAAIRGRAVEAFPNMDSFSRCLLGRFAQMCRDRG